MLNRMKWLCGGALFLSIVLFLVPAMATDTWQQTSGPAGGDVQALAIDPVTPQTVYAGTDNGLFKSTNGGGSWSVVNNGLTNLDVISLAIDPTSPQTVYAGTVKGLFKTTNGGDSWSAASTGMTYTQFWSLAIDPTTPQTVYAGTDSGLIKSTNGGGSWSAVGSGLMQYYVVVALAIDPISPQTVYAGTRYGSGVYKTTNGGGSWSTLNNGLTYRDVWSLAIDPASPQTVYAGTGNGVFKSTNGGDSWSAVNTGLTDTRLESLAIDPTSPQTVYAGTDNGVFKSTNGGGSWSEAGNGPSGDIVYSLVIDPTSPQTVYAGTFRGGVYKSTNGSNAWDAVNSGLFAIIVQSLVIDPSSPQTVYAGTDNGVYKTTSGGSSWSAVNSGLTDPSVDSLAIDPSNSQTVYAGSGTGVYKTTNGGDSWIEVYNGQESHSWSLAIDPANPLTVFAGATSYGGVLVKSTNGGGSWDEVNRNIMVYRDFIDVYALAIDQTDSQTIYAAAGNMDGPSYAVYKSTNGGISWSEANNGLTYTSPNVEYTIPVYSLAIDPTSPQTVYAGVGGYADGVYKSTNGGGSWSEANTGLTDTSVWSLAIDPTSPQTVYAGTWDGGVYKTTNGGGSWSTANTGLTDTSVWSLAIDPTSPQTVYAGTRRGVFKGHFTPDIPTITGTPVTTLNVGTPYSFTPTATNAASFSMTGAIPPGLDFNTSTGTLSGTPTTVGTYSGIIITAINSSGTASLPAFSLFVTNNRTLSLGFTGTGAGTVTWGSTACNSNCLLSLPFGTVVTLQKTPDQYSLFSGWSGACSGEGDCFFTMTGDAAVIADFNLDYPNSVLVVGGRTYPGISTAYADEINGATISIYAWGISFPESLIFDLDKTVSLLGGYDSTFTDRSAGMTTVYGLTVERGVVTVANLIVK